MNRVRELPIVPVLKLIREALSERGSAVVQAAPGAGKTTVVPLALLEESWLGGKRIVMLEPRRLAARMAASRMADILGEEVGDTVGYHIRQDRCFSERTRILTVTEAMLVRYLQNDPGLEGIGAVIFDEFHERSIHSDLSLALCLDARKALIPELRTLVMSATMEAAPAAELLGKAPVIEQRGRIYPVETYYLSREKYRKDHVINLTFRNILRALEDQEGGILVFLPGGGEIRRVQKLLQESIEGSSIMICPLYGDLPKHLQDRAVLPAASGMRKIVLSTSVAETSLTIEDIKTVVDSGLMRVPRFDASSGMTRLVTQTVSQACAEQRRGRAGRTGLGACYRMWTRGRQKTLIPFTSPEILNTDLVPLVLETAQWGATDPEQLQWIDSPPRHAVQQARELLTELGALDELDGHITPHGKKMAKLSMHPRFSNMIYRAANHGLGGLACYIASLMDERDFVRFSKSEKRDCDIRLRLKLLLKRDERPSSPGGFSIQRSALRRARKAAIKRMKRLGFPEVTPRELDKSGAMLALAYPERIAKAKPDTIGQFQTAGGRAAFLPPEDILANAAFLAVGAMGGDRRNARIFLAAPLECDEIESFFADRIKNEEIVHWNSEKKSVEALRLKKLRNLVLEKAPLSGIDPARAAAAMIEGIRELGLKCLPWNKKSRSFKDRVEFLRRFEYEEKGETEWPDMSDEGLLKNLESWAGPYLIGITSADSLKRLDLCAILSGLLDYRQKQKLDTLAPTHITVPSGSKRPVDYTGDKPVLAVRLQEMFGLRHTPAIAGGKVNLLLHLLSPAGRPLQITQNLDGFWKSSYHEVKKEMKGRYPKHYWPDDPYSCPPTKRTKPKRKR